MPERLFHIKKENIGLIEIMGRAILPRAWRPSFPAVKDECSRAFYEILMATGVFKDDPPAAAAGRLSSRLSRSVAARRRRCGGRPQAAREVHLLVWRMPAFCLAMAIWSKTVSTPSKSGSRRPRRCPRVTMTP